MAYDEAISIPFASPNPTVTTPPICNAVVVILKVRESEMKGSDEIHYVQAFISVGVSPGF